MKANRLFVCILLLPIILSCQKEEPTLSASHRWQITESVIIDGKLSKRGKYTALLLADNSLELWNNTVQQKVSVWQSGQLVNDTTLLDLSDTAEFILSASDRIVQVWHAESEESLGLVDFSERLGDARITQIRFWRSPHRFFIGTSGGDVIFADIQNNSYLVNRHHSSDVTKLELSEDKLTLFSGANDGLVVMWDLINYRPVITKSLPFRIVSLAIGANHHVFMSDALKDHIVWNSEQDSVIGQLTHWKRFQWFRHALFDPQQRWLVTSSPKTDMFLWRLNDMTLQGAWTVEAQTLGSSVADIVVTDKEQLRTLSSDAVLQDWDLSPFN